MCTHINLKSSGNDVVSARTMDFSFELEPTMIIVPRKYPMKFNNIGIIESHYGFLGLGKDIDGYKFADGVNECGLSCAALYFEGYASYNEKIEAKDNLASHELLHFILAKCKDVEESIETLNELNIVNDKLDFIGRAAPLHWIISDKTGRSIIVEPLESGLKIHENNIGVLTNSPDLDWHLTNLRNYIGLNTKQVKPREIGGLTFNPFGQGSATFGLPGDYTPPSRFVRTVFNKFSIEEPVDEETTVLSAIHVLNGVSIPKGSVKTALDTIDYTQYTSYMSLNTQNYYFKTYRNKPF